jgi:hypothetical protein
VKAFVTTLMALALASPVAAQVMAPPDPVSDQPEVSIRPFFLFTGQRFTATHTFDAVFGRSEQEFFGGGGEVAMRNGIYADVSVSRFKKTGQRAFVFNGRPISLGIPLTSTIIPIEVTGGYRLRLGQGGRVFSYAGAGVGSYGYQETSPSSDTGENVDTRRTGFLAVYGFEFRPVRLIGLTADVQYTHVPGILGKGGISQQFKESNLGGVAARFRFIVGR